MSFDPVAQFINAKNAFANARGVDPPRGVLHTDSGQPLIAAPKAVPRTTWGDVFLFGHSFRMWADPSREGCVELLKKAGRGEDEARVICKFGGHPHANFVHTAHYKNSDKLWREWQPLQVLAESRGTFGAARELASKIQSPATYPFNEEFWGYGVRYAIARSAAGVVRTRFEILIESVGEAVAEVPETIRNAVESAASAAASVVPDFSGTVRLLKWTSIVGGGALLYWYALKPKTRP